MRTLISVSQFKVQLIFFPALAKMAGNPSMNTALLFGEVLAAITAATAAIFLTQHKYEKSAQTSTAGVVSPSYTTCKS